MNKHTRTLTTNQYLQLQWGMPSVKYLYCSMWRQFNMHRNILFGNIRHILHKRHSTSKIRIRSLVLEPSLAVSRVSGIPVWRGRLWIWPILSDGLWIWYVLTILHRGRSTLARVVWIWFVLTVLLGHEGVVITLLVPAPAHTVPVSWNIKYKSSLQ